jgi:hypothetical protein
MKQTAVEWLIDRFNMLFMFHEGIPNELQKAYEQAKEMEKQQMLEFWNGGIDCTEEGGKSFEQYYNKTYKK